MIYYQFSVISDGQSIQSVLKKLFVHPNIQHTISVIDQHLLPTYLWTTGEFGRKKRLHNITQY